MSALRGVPVVKMRQKSDHKHWKTILISLYQYKLVPGRQTDQYAAVGLENPNHWNSHPETTLGEEEDSWKIERPPWQQVWAQET